MEIFFFAKFCVSFVFRFGIQSNFEMRLLFVCSLIALIVACSVAAPGSYFSKADTEAYKSLITGEFKNGEFGSLYNNLAAIEALILLRSPVTDTTKLCETAHNGMILFL
jgi:hypothetical protein